MLGRSSRIMAVAALAAVAGLAAAPLAGGGAERYAIRPEASPRTGGLRGLFGGGFGSAGFGRDRRGGYGWTNAHAKRVAKKKRNQARHRRACRG